MKNRLGLAVETASKFSQKASTADAANSVGVASNTTVHISLERETSPFLFEILFEVSVHFLDWRVLVK
jgi:hypothetical protein